MDIVIEGNQSINGEIIVKGAKNSAVAILPATLLFDGIFKISNMPKIKDVEWCLEILNTLGIANDFKNDTLLLESCEVSSIIESKIARKYRGSYYFMGVFLSRYNYVEISLPGGCEIGNRPIDYHLNAFRALGATILFEENKIVIKAEKLVGTRIKMPKKSVGATINAMFAAVYAEGKTVISNASIEPEVDDVIDFLNKAGCNVDRTDDKIIIIGKEKVVSVNLNHELIPDRIEALTYIVYGLSCGEIVVKNVNLDHLKSVLALLIYSNAKLEISHNSIKANKSNIKYFDVVSSEYPGIPTDICQMLSILMIINNGGIITETIFENRFKSLNELRKMGAKIETFDNHAVVFRSCIKGETIVGTDLRGAASLVLAAICAEGKTVIKDYEYVDRGYSGFLENLQKLGVMYSISMV